jgi:hypothetical protein
VLRAANHRRSKIAPFFTAVVTGLALSQAWATVFVHRSNATLAQTTDVLRRQGYLAVPGSWTEPSLTSLGAAVWGGLFYTLSAGAALALLAAAAAWLYANAFQRSGRAAVFFLAAWAALLFGLNADGLCPVVSLCAALVPPAVLATALGRAPTQRTGARMALRLLPAATVAALAVFWSTQFNDHLFVNIRDYFLLSSPVGTKINDFYYRYTLFAAEAFKPLSQKTLHTCDLSGLTDPVLRHRIGSRLRSYDYLPVKTGAATVDLSLTAVNGGLAFVRNGRAVLFSEENAFFSDTAGLLARFSEITDRYGFFRRFTFYGILFAFPIALFTALYGILRRGADIFLGEGLAALAAAAVCFALGAAAAVPLQLAENRSTDAGSPAVALNSGQWQQRVAALRAIEADGLEIADMAGYARTLDSPRLSERYWSARAMSVSRRPETLQHLLALLRDPQPIVVCQALYALGRRQDRNATGAVLDTLKRSPNWYVQQYAYRALRLLGWTQPASI